MDLVDQAPWHRELNGGLVPILETPCGKLIIESAIIMAYADESTDGI